MSCSCLIVSSAAVTKGLFWLCPREVEAIMDRKAWQQKRAADWTVWSVPDSGTRKKEQAVSLQSLLPVSYTSSQDSHPLGSACASTSPTVGFSHLDHSDGYIKL